MDICLPGAFFGMLYEESYLVVVESFLLRITLPVPQLLSSVKLLDPSKTSDTLVTVRTLLITDD